MLDIDHQTEYVKIDNINIPIWIFGDIKNPILLLIHGHPIPFSNYVGDVVINHIKDKYCIIAFDLPGYGESKNVLMERHLFIDHIVKNRINNREFVILGTSFGGLTSIEYYLKTHNSNLKGLIIAGMPYFKFLPKLSTAIRLIFKYPLLQVLKEFSLLTDKNLKEVNIPTILLYSKKDILATTKMGIKLSKYIKNSELTVVNDKTHDILLADINKNEFGISINNFLGKYL